jgi:hypothetical protein
MGKSAYALGLILLAGPVVGQEMQSFPPSRATTASTFVNAEVVRVNAATGVTVFRSESGEEVVAAGPEVTAGLRLRPGQKVLVSFRTTLDAGGRQAQVVTHVREASPTSGEPAGVVASPAGNVRTVRVLRTDRRRRTVTVFDESGRLAVLPVGRSLSNQLGGLNAGDTVALTLSGLGTNGTLSAASVTGIAPAAATFPFAGGVFPAVSGTFVRSNPASNEITLMTSAGQLTFPVGSGVLTNLRGVRPGENLSLNFDVTTASNAARGAGGPNAVRPVALTGGGAGVTTAQVTGVLPAIPEAGTFQSSGVNSGRSPIARNVVSPNAQTLAGQPNAQGQVVSGQPGASTAATTGLTNTSAGNVPGAGAAVPPGQAAPGASQTGVVAGTPGATGAAATAGAPTGASGTTTTGPVVGTGGVVVGGGPTSPLVSNVPSVPNAAPVVAAVLPPAVAKAPQNASEVGVNREQGVRDLDAAAVAMAGAAADIDVAWARFKGQCLGGFTVTAKAGSGREWYALAADQVRTPNDDACRATYADLVSRAKGFVAQLDTVEDAARKADVMPGTVREVFERHHLR